MRFHLSYAFTLAFSLVAASLVVAAPAYAAEGSCAVRDLKSGVTYGPDTGAALAAGLASAVGGDELQVGGTCAGDYQTPEVRGLNIVGAADGSTIITAPQGGVDVLTVQRAGIQLAHLTFTGITHGGVIYSDGRLRMHDVSVIDNRVHTVIQTTRGLSVVHSVIARNTGKISAAIEIYFQGWLYMKHTFVLHNVSLGTHIGGIDNEGYRSAQAIDSVVAHNRPTDCYHVLGCDLPQQ